MDEEDETYYDQEETEDLQETQEGTEDLSGSDMGDNEGPIRTPRKKLNTKDIKELAKKLATKNHVAIIIAIIIIVIVVAIVVVVLMVESEVKEGSNVEGDESNVPYVVTSQILDRLVIDENEAGETDFFFEDDNGNKLTVDEALDNVLKTLKINDSSSYKDMGDTDKERKKFLKKLIQAEIATQYPDISKQGKGISGGGSSSMSASELAQWGWLIQNENINAYYYEHGLGGVTYDTPFVNGYITEDGKDYIVFPNSTGWYVGPGMQLYSGGAWNTFNTDLLEKYGADTSNIQVGGKIDANAVDLASQDVFKYKKDEIQNQAIAMGLNLSENQIVALVDISYLNGNVNAQLNNIATYGADSEQLANTSGFAPIGENDVPSTRPQLVWKLFHYGKYESRSGNLYNPDDFGGVEEESTPDSDGDSPAPSGNSNGIKGNIKIKRKDSKGNETDLLYLKESEFDKLVNANDSRVLNYYTLKKTAKKTTTTSSGTTDYSGSNIEEIIWNFLKSKGLSDECSAGIIGNLKVESAGLNTDIIEDGSGVGFGLAQWSYGRRTQIEQYAAYMEKEPSDLKVQLDFLWMETDPNAERKVAGLESNVADLQWSPSTYEQFLAAKDIDTATSIFCYQWERPRVPHYNERLNGAMETYNLYAGTGGGSSSDDSDSSESDDETKKNQDSSKSDDKSKEDSDSSSSGGTSNGVVLTADGNLDFLDCAVEAHEIVSKNGFTYDCSGRELPILENDPRRTVDCSSYVSMAMYLYGITDWQYFPHQLTDSTLIQYGDQNLEVVYTGSAGSYAEIPNLASGDILLMPGHTQIFYGYTSDGSPVWLNCGSNDSIQKPEGQDIGWCATPITHVYRVPGGSGGKPVVTSLDDFLFIGDSRYASTASQISALGANIKNVGVGSARVDEWLKVASNGGKGTVQSTSVDITGSYSGISVQLGANSVLGDVSTAVSDMKSFIDKLKELHPNTPIFVNSCMQVNSKANSSGYSWSPEQMKNNIDDFNKQVSSYCDQTKDVYYVDISDGLNDADGYLKAEYTDDGLHCNGSGAQVFANNIKEAILNVTNGRTKRPDDSEGDGNGSTYKLIVASSTTTNVTTVSSFEYMYSRMVSTNSGTTGVGNRFSSTPANQTIANTTTTKYTTTSVDYQEALKEHTTYFDFLWAIFVDSRNKDLVTKWADLAIEGDMELTAFIDEKVNTNSSTSDGSTLVLTNFSNGTSNEDTYRRINTTTTTTTTRTTKLGVTYADTWMLEYKNDADNYQEYKSKSKEEQREKTESDDDIMKLLSKSEDRIKRLKDGEYKVERMLEDNEKVSFMYDIYKYFVDMAYSGKSKEFKSLTDVINISSFDLSSFTPTTRGNGNSGEGGTGGEESGETGDGYSSTFTVGTRTFKNYKQGRWQLGS